MLRYLVGRLAQGLVVVVAAMSLAFFMVNGIGNPVNALGAGVEVSAAERARLLHEYGFDQPLLVHYGHFLLSALSGNLGNSFTSANPAAGLALHALSNTAILVVGAVLLAWAAAAPLAVYSAIRPASRTARAIRALLILLQGIPDFWLALMLIIAFAVKLAWLPAVADGSPAAVVLPTVALAVPLISIFTRLLLSQLSDVMSGDFTAAMRVRGLTDRQIVLRHALPNTLGPLIAYMALQLGWLLGGTVIVELIFGWPGIGNLAILATRQQDLPVVTAVIVGTASAFVLLNLVADVVVATLDPRIRLAR